MKALEQFLKPTQAKLFKMLCKMFDGKNCTVSRKNFILVEGEVPVMLIAHLDTVHKEPVRDICKSKDKNILMSPQGIGGDDRCGVYALVNAYELSKKKPHLLFTCDEEIGGIGAGYFCDTHAKGKLPKSLDDLKMLIEIDRKGSHDAVYYDCCNADFEDYITSKGFKTAYGSFSDISLIAPELGVAAVNLSSGYHNAHTQHEYINRAEINATMFKVIEMIEDAAKEDFPKYEYVGWEDYFIDDYNWDMTKPLSKKDEDYYYDLLASGYYTVGELEEMRNYYGDSVLKSLHADNFKSECCKYGASKIY